MASRLRVFFLFVAWLAFAASEEAQTVSLAPNVKLSSLRVSPQQPAGRALKQFPVGGVAIPGVQIPQVNIAFAVSVAISSGDANSLAVALASANAGGGSATAVSQAIAQSYSQNPSATTNTLANALAISQANGQSQAAANAISTAFSTGGTQAQAFSAAIAQTQTIGRPVYDITRRVPKDKRKHCPQCRWGDENDGVYVLGNPNQQRGNVAVFGDNDNNGRNKRENRNNGNGNGRGNNGQQGAPGQFAVFGGRRALRQFITTPSSVSLAVSSALASGNAQNLAVAFSYASAGGANADAFAAAVATSYVQNPTLTTTTLAQALALAQTQGLAGGAALAASSAFASGGPQAQAFSTAFARSQTYGNIGDIITRVPNYPRNNYSASTAQATATASAINNNGFLPGVGFIPVGLGRK